MKVLVLNASPRLDGNSARLSGAAAEGAALGGFDVAQVQLCQAMSSFLRDCAQCRVDGDCSVDDGYRSLFIDQFLPANGVIVATPIYWYGMAAQLKAFFDRMFCYVASSYPDAEQVKRAMAGKRVGLLVSSEEAYPTVSAGIVQQLQLYCRYTRSTFAGVVHGYGNARGEVARDPGAPMEQARRLGRNLFSTYATDYAIDTPRPRTVWAGD